MTGNAMKSYTVHFPKGCTEPNADALTGAVLIRDGFSWGAFIFGPFWLLWNRLWLTGIIMLVVLITVSTLADMLEFEPITWGIADFLIMLLIGFEANSLKRWTYERRGQPVAGIVTGHDEIEAEAKMIAIGLHKRPKPVKKEPPVQAGPLAAANASDALGIFPLLEKSR
ncbi:DUF2628 domain-containing protein [Microvirga sp. W0021]|uniref:DUF2628 domain-containing protein n=1 Tax=Hohaiivirga grylli TaxID=3133970 RepID=A0ABV0BF87_9HYPH